MELSGYFKSETFLGISGLELRMNIDRLVSELVTLYDKIEGLTTIRAQCTRLLFRY
jgi:hypothetical protein